MNPGGVSGMSLLEYHVLLALASAPLHGYAIKDVVAAESGGTLTPRAGSLYRVIARLMTVGFVKDTELANSPAHPGLARKSGHIGLLGHGTRVEFRNFRIQELP